MIHIRAKGVNSNSLNYEKFINLLNNKNTYENAIKTTSKTDWNLGQVIIASKDDIKISNESYLKRLKVYNLEDKWIETRPIIINGIDKKVVIFLYITTYLSR